MLLIGMAIGAAGAISLAQALAKRGAHGRASMLILDRHVRNLHGLTDEVACGSAASRRRVEQIRFAAREIDFAFDAAREGGFRRQQAAFLAVSDSGAEARTCDQLSVWLDRLDQRCQACHRDYR